ncbi:family 20 glycosylhydrolase [Spirosoma panaciterrae]|uniref:family 20 glycosylhydrolase n=1 Tax=Spirosoma panaciterrae TaxID=496058 RepID=UPI000593A336|nr:family 20 glycosylhydrolase [Spirosoma panaciterrae]
MTCTRIALMLLSFIQQVATAGHPPLLPAPQQISWTDQRFSINGTITITTTTPNCQPITDSLKNWLERFPKTSVRAVADSTHQRTTKQIGLRLEPNGLFRNQPEGYSLTVSGSTIHLSAATGQGLFWAYRTLQQLVQHQPQPYLAGCRITDFPAFPIRGFMHDVGRSFIPIERLKEHIAILSRYKINTFHWHLTEDLAWRLESDVIPSLTDSAVTQRFPGLFYTKQQARELVDFCKALHVLLIPEIDMPGHSGAFRRATGYDMQSDSGKVLVKKLLREVCALFDVPYIHIGTDEVAFKDARFVPEMAAAVRACGKEVIGWYPGAALDTSAIRQLWIRNNRPLPPMKFIESRNLYFNHFATQADLIGLFQRNLCDVPNATPTRLGAIGCIWNDRKLTDVDQIERLNGFYPLMLTLAERSWRGGGQAETAAGVVLTDKGAFAEFENRLLMHKRLHFSRLNFPYVAQSALHWRLSQPYPNGGDPHASFPPETEPTDFAGNPATGATIYLRHTWGPEIVRGYIDKPRPNHTVYAYTYVYSPRHQRVGAWIDFHTYGRSEKDASPPAGQWDYKGSRIWINGKAIDPPVWSTPGLHPVDLETPYTNEPYENRPPVVVPLRKGWNKVLLKLPVGAFQTADYRLVKWMFTCVFVRPAGMNYEIAEELIFLPDRHLSTQKAND